MKNIKILTLSFAFMGTILSSETSHESLVAYGYQRLSLKTIENINWLSEYSPHKEIKKEAAIFLKYYKFKQTIQNGNPTPVIINFSREDNSLGIANYKLMNIQAYREANKFKDERERLRKAGAILGVLGWIGLICTKFLCKTKNPLGFYGGFSMGALTLCSGLYSLAYSFIKSEDELLAVKKYATKHPQYKVYDTLNAKVPSTVHLFPLLTGKLYQMNNKCLFDDNDTKGKELPFYTRVKNNYS